MNALLAHWPMLRFSPLLGVIFLAGCEDSSREEKARPYPPRTDLLLTGSLRGTPLGPEPPGQLGANLPQLREEDRQLFFDPASLPRQKRRRLQTLLEQTFGSVDHPSAGVAASIRFALKLDEDTLAHGGQLFRVHCLHCHGLTGDGRGPDAPYQLPRPRDFRPGIFKCTSTYGDNGRKPCRDDLRRVVRDGVPGTSMRAYNTLAEADREALASYTIHLSIRGEVEENVLLSLREDDNKDIYNVFADCRARIAHRWLDAASEDRRLRSTIPWKPLTGAEREASIARGQRLFTDTKKTGCILCHADYGRQSAWFYDAWGHAERPSDLTTGVYRGGGQPLDLYCRIYAGINGTAMPAYGESLSKRDIWDLVNFLLVLPHAKERPEKGDAAG